MASLPVIIGFGGVSAAGRSCFHHAFMRLVYDVLPMAEQHKVLQSLAHLMGNANLAAENPQYLLDHTLVREIEAHYFDPDRIYSQSKAELHPNGEAACWRMHKRDLPTPIPAHWELQEVDNGQVIVNAHASSTVLLPNYSRSRARVAGQLPTGFLPGSKYPSRNHPRGLQLAIYGASDAVHSIGIRWDALMHKIAPDQISVYASSGMGQLDDEGHGGMIKNMLIGKRTTSKNCPLGFAQMPADFINAYVLGSIGNTGGLLGACATFLYNLEKAVSDIQTGRAKIALVGAAEAPITPEIIEGYRIMGALAEDQDLLALDGLKEGKPDYRRACRPFGVNCGFTLGESTQYLVLMADDIALETGATIYGAVPGVFINSDGFKKSISSPGIGNYLTLGRACGMAEKILGRKGLQQHTLLHAHGTGTPQNRTTESHVFDQVARAFDIHDWHVAATKCYIGHSIGPAAGDQINFALGSFATGIAPGIVTVEEFADDVHKERLALSNRHRQYSPDHWQAAFINSKGFGGNNATALLLSPFVTQRLLEKKHGRASLVAYQGKNAVVAEKQSHYEAALLEGYDNAIYHFGDHVVDSNLVEVNRENIHVPGYHLPVSLDIPNPFGSIEE